MKVLLIKNSIIQNYVLPETVSGNFWITDIDVNGNKRYLINIDEYQGKWKLNSNHDTKIIVNNAVQQSILLSDYTFCFLNVNGEQTSFILYFLPTIDNNFQKLDINNYNELTIGSSNDNAIIYNSPLIAPTHAKLTMQDGMWTIQNLDNKFGTYVNNQLINNVILFNGDIIFIMGLKVILINNFVLINNPNNSVTYNPMYLTLKPAFSLKPIEEVPQNDDLVIELYKKQDYFFKEPRFKKRIIPITVKIDPPPQKEKKDETPAILTIGPMLTMGMTSGVMAFTSLNNVMSGKQNMDNAIPSLITSGAMLMSMIFWPMLTKVFQTNLKMKNEKVRKEKYTKYIDEKRKYIEEQIEEQKSILIDIYKPIDECRKIIMERKRNLWERKIESEDFMSVRIGIGDLKPDITIEAPEEHFTLDDDDLFEMVTDLAKEHEVIKDVPVTFSLIDKYIAAIIGDYNLTKLFLDTIFLQLMTFHSYSDLKIVIFTTKQKSIRWEYLKYSPHCWDNNKNIRYFGTTIDEINQISNEIEEAFNARKYKEVSNGELAQSDVDYKSYEPYYLILTDDFDSIRNVGIIRKVLTQTVNYGFTLLINQDATSRLPNQCTTFINIDKENATLLESSLYTNNQKEFVPEFNTTVNMEECAIALSNIPIEFSKGAYDLPKMITFLEMFGVGKIEQLNALNNWKVNDTTITLQAPVGVNQNGDTFKLDLHEKAHGPHGLVAGMTGSGKSEFIMTYILSMAVNYSPEEVAFVLIDYKGGGLAGAFENKETGVKLPHLAGTITNLDTVEMKRSLASIQSELKTRQKIFNEAREISGESTIDIYKYQRLYREGVVKEPVPHLLIISDEFAELKDQQPEFMDQLISTARIGRSLGVHLILATQKPSGVVDAQIWSNSKFRVCLKVQEKADSMDMIKVPDAAAIKEAGRFYLQVGYNEFFALGQSAWCGAPYIPSDKIKKKVDTSINFIDNVGNIIKSIDYRDTKSEQKPLGEQLPNIVKYLSNIASKQEISVRQLWLERIPDVIYVDNLKKKYNYVAEPLNINPIIGEYDDPSNQYQGLLTLPLSTEGNTIIYGSSGSGKDILLSTIIYSSIIEHSVDEVNFYILDFAAETTRVFEQAPHVGDILFTNDTEKVSNLFKMLKSTIDTRKSLFKDYNGDFNYYCKNSGNVIPLIVVVIHNYEAFSDTYSDYEDQLLQLTREGVKYGLIFILTAYGVNSIRYRLSQNFKQNLVLQLNDESDYSSVLGNVRGMYPSQIKGRGLIKFDNIYEFQSAYPYLKDKMSEFLKTVSQKLSTLYKDTAQRVPVLPEKVTYSFVSKDLKGLDSVPIGVEKQSLEISLFDFKSKYINLVSAQEQDSMKKFTSALIYELYKIENLNLIVIDALELVNKQIVTSINISYTNNNFNETIDKIYNYEEEINKVYKENNSNEESLKNYQQTVCVIIGIGDFKKKVSGEFKTKFESLIKNGKATEKFNFILIDTIDQIKSCEYEPWYRENVTNNAGIWIGNGISEQFTIKLSKTPRSLYDTIEESFGYSIKLGMATQIKLIEMDEIPKDDVEFISF